METIKARWQTTSRQDGTPRLNAYARKPREGTPLVATMLWDWMMQHGASRPWSPQQHLKQALSMTRAFLHQQSRLDALLTQVPICLSPIKTPTTATFYLLPLSRWVGPNRQRPPDEGVLSRGLALVSSFLLLHLQLKEHYV